MLDYIRGKLTFLDSDYAVIDVGGWGAKLAISFFTHNKIKDMQNDEVKLYCLMIVREDSIELVGFYDELEREAFTLLNKVPGIGPKVGLAVLSLMSVGKLKASIMTEDIKTLTTVPGIGKKTAQKIIIDLKDRIKDLPVDSTEDYPNTVFEATEVLMSLGFSNNEIQLALDDDFLCADYTVEDIVKRALKKLSK